MGIEIFLGICLVLIFLLIYNNQENFDTYRNHDFGAYYVYKNSNAKINGSPIKTVDQAALKAKYDWSQRDRLGNNVYDKMYDNSIQQKTWDYGYKNIGMDAHDTKFSTLGENQMATYKISDMLDPNSVYIKIRDQTITLAQKQY